MLEWIHEAVLETNKKRPFFEKVLPAILARQEVETIASIVELADTVVEAFIIAGLVEAEVNHQPIADVLEPAIRRQIDRGVNLTLNRSRLIEVLIHLGRESEAETAIMAFKTDFGPDYMLPGLYIYRPLYSSVDEAVAAMRERAQALEMTSSK